jgi:hypothetical protein
VIQERLATLVAHATDDQLERALGSRAAQRLLVGAMASSFDAEAAAGFEGHIVYELTRPATGRHPRYWTLDIAGGHVHVRRGGDGDAVVHVTYQVSDMIRIAARVLDPAAPMLNDRATVKGDFGIAFRLPEMFPTPPPRY